MSDSGQRDGDWDTAGYVVASKYRAAVLRSLADGPATPGTIAEHSGVQLQHVSRALQQLRDRGLVELLVEEDRRKGRVYGPTDAAAEVLDLVGELDGGETA